MMEMMETLSMLELDREMDWIESKVIEMMEEDIEDGQDIQDELEDEDGDQVMPEVDTLTSKEMMDTSDMYTRPEETEMQVVEDNHTITSGSVVGVESYNDYPHHYGGGAHTVARTNYHTRKGGGVGPGNWVATHRRKVC